MVIGYSESFTLNFIIILLYYIIHYIVIYYNYKLL